MLIIRSGYLSNLRPRQHQHPPTSSSQQHHPVFRDGIHVGPKAPWAGKLHKPSTRGCLHVTAPSTRAVRWRSPEERLESHTDASARTVYERHQQSGQLRSRSIHKVARGNSFWTAFRGLGVLLKTGKKLRSGVWVVMTVLELQLVRTDWRYERVRSIGRKEQTQRCDSLLPWLFLGY